MRSLLKFNITILMLVLFTSSCAEKKIDPYALQIMPEDQVTSAFPPSKEELVPILKQIIVLVASKNETVSQSRLDRLTDFIRSGIHNYSNIKSVPQHELDNSFKEKEFHAFQPDNVSEAIRLGEKLNAKFAGQLQLTIKEAKMEKGIDRFVANINFATFTTDDGKMMFKKDIEYDASSPQKSAKRLKELIQKHFPIKAFILETRGNHQVAKISAGRSLGNNLGRQFNIRERTVEYTITTGIVRKSISYSQKIIAQVEVFKIMENEAWVFIQEKDRAKIKLRQVLFSLVEK